MLYAFIISLCLLIAAITLLIVLPLYKKYRLKNKTVPTYGKNIYEFANMEDYYLINSLCFDLPDKKKLPIDHLLFGNKYLYIIKDIYYDGAIKYKSRDLKWLFYYGKGKKPKMNYIVNYIALNEEKIKLFSGLSGLNKSLFISIVITNNDLIIDNYASDCGNSYLVKRKDLPKLIQKIENRDVPSLNSKELKFAVKDIARLKSKS